MSASVSIKTHANNRSTRRKMKWERQPHLRAKMRIVSIVFPIILKNFAGEDITTFVRY